MTKAWIVVISVAVALAVGISGTYVYMNNQSEDERAELEAQITELEATASAMATTSAVATASTTTTDETADWKTYTNDEYGFSFKYPAELELLDGSNSNSVTLHDFPIEKQQPSLIAISWKQYTGTLLSDVKERAADNTFADYAEYTFNGSEAYEGVDNGLLSKYGITVKHIDQVFTISARAANRSTLAENKAQLTDEQTQILSTFQFTSK